MKFLWAMFLVPALFVMAAVAAPSAVGNSLPAAVRLIETASASSGAGFPLVVNGTAAPVVLPPDAPDVVKIAAYDLTADLAAVSGVTPEVLTGPPADQTRPRVELVFAPELAGRWEAFGHSASFNVLTIAGADRRGLAYGVYELSRRIGVSPWHWWADVPVRKPVEWMERVLANAKEATLKLPQPLAPGWHTLRLIAVDAGVVVDKIVLDLGGLVASYDGPAETRL